MPPHEEQPQRLRAPLVLVHASQHSRRFGRSIAAKPLLAEQGIPAVTKWFGYSLDGTNIRAAGLLREKHGAFPEFVQIAASEMRNKFLLLLFGAVLLNKKSDAVSHADRAIQPLFGL